jgi:hypothetical protein
MTHALPDQRSTTVKDVATFCRWKFLVEAVVRIPVGALLFTVGVLTPLMFQEDIRNGHASPVALVMGLFPLLLGYGIFASGVRRVQAACQRGCWLRAGPAGISFRLPYKAEWRTGFLTNRRAERSIAWPEIRRICLLQYKVNGIPFGQALVLDTAQGRYNFGGYFREAAGSIVASLEAHRTSAP